MQSYFVTGTDTDVGKTVATVLLLDALKSLNKSTLGIKPISAGCELTNDGLRNEDALKLQAASSIKADYQVINPIAYAPFIAPHIAASQVNEHIDMSQLQDCLIKAKSLNPSYLLIEGAGGWRLPLNNDGLYFSNFAEQNLIDVILVVGMKLGCLNHAILSYQAIVADGLNCVAWVANQVESKMPHYEDNLASLHALLPCPLIAEIPFQPQPINQIILSEHFLKVF